MTIILLILATLPPLFLAYYMYQKDVHEREPKKLIFFSLLLGAISVIPVLILESIADLTVNEINLFIKVLIGVALVEEGVKYFFLMKFLYIKPDFNEPFDGIVYTVMLSLGFALVENIVYVFGYYSNQGMLTAILRMFTAIPMHTVFGVVMGYYVGLSKFNENKKTSLKITGLLLAVILHFLYDYFLFLSLDENYSGVSILSFVILIIGIYYANKAIKTHQENSPFKKESQTAIELEKVQSVSTTEPSEHTEEVSDLKKAGDGYIILGFAFSMLGGYLGMCMGFNYAWGKYDKKTKRLGWAMIIISFIGMVIFNSI